MSPEARDELRKLVYRYNFAHVLEVTAEVYIEKAACAEYRNWIGARMRDHANAVLRTAKRIRKELLTHHQTYSGQNMTKPDADASYTADGGNRDELACAPQTNRRIQMNACRCVVCARDISRDWSRCTNGCCAQCHARFCTPGGQTSPGHGINIKAARAELTKEHEAKPDCWCEPELDYTDEITGVSVWTHRQIQ